MFTGGVVSGYNFQRGPRDLENQGEREPLIREDKIRKGTNE